MPSSPTYLLFYLSLIVPFSLFATSACEARGESMPPSHEAAGDERAMATTPEPEAAPTSARASTLIDRYAWLAGREFAQLEVVSLARRFSPPRGYTRVDVSEGSFASFLRHLPIRTDRTHVLSYAKKRLSSPSAAVVAMDVGQKNLQQCADTAIRLHAEYLWATNQRDRLGYHFTSGDRTGWSDWKKGERFVVSGSNVERVQRGAVEASHASFRRWLDTVFMYAGTRSLRLDSKPFEQSLLPGDFFVAPGSPGHAVIVLDVAENARGERVALLGQGFMPAQELHVLRSRQSLDEVWFELPEKGQTLDTPSWRPFRRSQARRFF